MQYRVILDKINEDINIEFTVLVTVYNQEKLIL